METASRPNRLAASRPAAVTLLDHSVYVPLAVQLADGGFSETWPVLPRPTPSATPTPPLSPSPAPTSTPGQGSLKAELVTKSYPRQMQPGQRSTAYVEFRNNGSVTWHNSEAVAIQLRTSGPRERISAFYTSGDWEDVATPTRLDQYRVEAGQTGRFTFALTAPNVPGSTFTESFALLAAEGSSVTWVEAGEVQFDIEVLSPSPTPTATPTPSPVASTTPQPPAATFTPTPAPTPTPQPQPPPIPSFGVWVYYSSYLGGHARIREMGIDLARVPVSWKEIEPSKTDPPTYVWSKFDSIFSRTGGSGMQVMATISDNPGWASSYANGPIDRVDLRHYRDFLTALASRYKDPPYNVKYWEIYNEPDNTWPSYATNPESGIAYWGNNPGGYVDLLAASYQAIKAADAQAQVLMGALAMDWFTDEGGPFARDFLDQVLSTGGGQYFDIVSFHYFPVFRWRWNTYGKDLIGKTAFIQQVMASHDIVKPIIANEVGMWSDPRMGGNAELQAQYVPQVFSRGKAAGLLAMVWFMLMDDAAWDAKHGLLNPDLSPKPAFYAYQTLTAQLNGLRYERTLAFSGHGDWDLEGYSFVDTSGRRINVIWSTSGASRSLSLAATEVRRVDLYGAVSEHLDMDDGASDGRVSVQVGPGPVYLEVLR